MIPKITPMSGRLTSATRESCHEMVNIMMSTPTTVSTFVTAVESDKARNEDFNISTAESTTVRELAEVIWRKIKGPDVPLRLTSDDPFEYDVQKRVPDVTKAREVLGFTAGTGLSEMLDEVIPWIERAIEEGTI